MGDPDTGGEPRRVVTNLKGAVGVSPDGQRVVFLRDYLAQRETALIIADVFGGSERRLATGSFQDTWFEGPAVAWSADGKLISATQATIVGGYRMRPVSVDAETGKVQTLGSETWAQVGRTTFLPGNRGILFAASERILGAYQFWIAPFLPAVRRALPATPAGSAASASA